jgi:hypothetical protein
VSDLYLLLASILYYVVSDCESANALDGRDDVAIDTPCIVIDELIMQTERPPTRSMKMKGSTDLLAI